MRVCNQLTTARREEPPNTAVGSRWAWARPWPGPAAAPHDARTGRAPGRYAGALRWLAQRSRAPGRPAGEPLEAAAFPQIFQSQAARPAAWAVARPAAWAVARRRPRDDLLAGVAPVGGQDRRWLCRELHDGLGPALAGLVLGLGTAQARSAGDPDLQRLLGRLAADAQRAVTDLRCLVYGLRPAALEELGLPGSLRHEVGRVRCAVPALAVSLELPGDGLAGLPAAVEEACYRIVTEALTNVARHARATRCTVAVHVDHGLHIDVRDNGVGLPDGWRAGAGVASMRDRAGELGGDLVIGPGLPGGTRVAARLPRGGQP